MAFLSRTWLNRGNSITSRLFSVLDEKVDDSVPIEKRVATLAHELNIKQLSDIVEKAINFLNPLDSSRDTRFGWRA